MSLWKVSLILVPALAVLAGVAITYLDAFSSLRLLLTNAGAGSVAVPQTFVFSEDPLIVYIKDFLTVQEAAHLVRLADERFAPSLMWDEQGKPHMDKAYRLSLTARLPREDAVVRSMEQRARTFPFYRDFGDFLPLVVQNYGVSGQYRDHFDWFDDAHAVGGNIASTFFVYIHANCTGGGTGFSRLAPPPTGLDARKSGEEEDMWCEFIDCDRPLDEGVIFKPILGNAVFWENLLDSGAGHTKTLHAGMPVTSGNKMGLNMWTWKAASS